MTITEIRRTLEQRKGQMQHLQTSLRDSRTLLRNLLRRGRRLEQALTVVQLVAQETQETLEYHVSELVSLALAAVFEDPYELQVDFVVKRGQTEAELYFVRGDERIHPLQASGGGAVVVAAFALRISLWSLRQPHSRAVLILDEPFKDLNDPSRRLHEKAAAMVKMLCDRLGIQIIMVTLLPELIDHADKVFNVSIQDRISIIEEKE